MLLQFIYCRQQLLTLVFFLGSFFLGPIFCQCTETLVHLVFCRSKSLSHRLPVPILCENKIYLNFFHSSFFVAINLVPRVPFHVWSESQHCGVSWKDLNEFKLIIYVLPAECLAPIYVENYELPSSSSAVTRIVVSLEGKKKSQLKNWNQCGRWLDLRAGLQANLQLVAIWVRYIVLLRKDGRGKS